ncbi:MAG: hypothetical protein ABIS06_11815, partial [Vicinamibacterales bacterium]
NAGRHLVTISPDGQRIAFVANRRLHVRQVGSFETKTIAGSDGSGAVVNPAFSADGEHIAFYSDGALRRVAVSGGPPRTLATIQSPFGIHWSDRYIYVGLGPGGIGRVPADGGKLETIVKVGPHESAQGPRRLPNGDWILFTLASGATETRWDTAQIIAYSPTSGERKVLIEGASDGRYVSTGHLLYGISGIVFAVPFDVASLTVRGTPAAAVQGVAHSNVTGASQFDVSTDGALVYVPGPASVSASERRIGFLDRSGTATPLNIPAGAYEAPRVSPRDPMQIAFGQVGDVTADLWIYNLSGSSAMRRLTFGGRNRFPVWSPDGRQVAFQSDREGDGGIFVQGADGSGTASRLTRSETGTFHVPDSWSPDGQWLLFTSVGLTRQVNILSIADNTVRPLGSLGASLARSSGAFSHDGRWVAYYETPPTGDVLVFVEPFPATGAKYQIVPAIHPAWSADGKELFTTPNSPDFVSFQITTTPAFAFRDGARIPREATVGSNPTGVRNYDVMPDGKRLLAVLGARSDSRQIDVVLNWFNELRGSGFNR